MTMVTKVTAITTDPIPDSKFALPEGYTKNRLRAQGLGLTASADAA